MISFVSPNTRVAFFCLLLILVPAWRFAAHAQFEAQHVIKHYSLREGLSQGVVNSVAQDSQSFIWIATEDGLNRFDGTSFKVFQFGHKLKNGLIDNFIQSLFNDKDGALWISSRNGLLRFDPDTESFERYTNVYDSSHIRTPNDVSYISEGSSGNLWVAWYGNGFGSFNKKAKEFSAYNTSNISGLSSDMTVAVLEDKHGLLWVGSQNGGINVFNVSNGKVTGKIKALSVSTNLPSPNVRSIVADNKQNIWIATAKGLVVYMRERNEFLNFNFNQAIKEQSIFSLIADSKENLWIGTQGNGIYRLDLRQFNTQDVADFTFSKIENLNEYDISRKTIQSFYEDKNGNMWIGTFGDGIYMVSSQKEQFIKYQKILTKGATFASVAFYGVCYDQQGNLWLGTDGNGLYKRSPSGYSEEHFTADGRPGSIKDDAILSAFCASDGTLWFGTYAHGLFQYEKRTNSFIHYKFDGDPLKGGGNDIRTIFEDSDKNLWIGTNRAGLCLVNRDRRSYASPGGFEGVLSEGDVRAIAEDSAGNLWLGFYGDGLYKFDYGSNELVPYFQNENGGRMQSRIIFTLRFDHVGRLWMGTAGAGLYVYDLRTDSIKNYTEEHGLTNNTVYSVLIDKNNNCWVSTNYGISKVEAESTRIINYHTLDGLQSGQFNPGSGFFNYISGYMCFGGTLGLNLFYPEEIHAEIQHPDVIVTGLQIFNRPVSITDSLNGKPVLAKVINKADHITLSHDQSVITFEFIGLNFSYPEKINYAYKLEGLDDDWNYVGNQRSATYRYLKPGKYEFRVKASSQANQWDDDHTSLAVVINPPVWRTPWAYVAYFLFACLFTFVIARFGKKQLSLRKRLKIEKAQRKHERRMAMEKLTFFTEISHEFRTPLTLIIGPLEEMLANEDRQSATARKLQMVHRNASKLLNLINKLLDYRKIESGNVILKVRESDIVIFTEEIYQSFLDLAKKKGIAFSFQSEVAELRMWFDREKLEMVFNNILSNSFKYIGSGNDISIHISQQISDRYPQGRAVVKIKDNGIGIPKKHLSSVFEWFYKGDNSGLMNSGIGLSLARKLVHLHKGEIFVESAEGKGSTFSIKIPLGKDHFKADEVAFVSEPSIENVTVTEEAPTHEEEIGVKRGMGTLLIVEDDEEIRQFLREYLEKHYKIIEAADGNDGLDIANKAHPDLIISDIMMPAMDGMELCRILKSSMRTSHIPIILLTAKTSLADHKEGIGIGADAYITKPFSPDILVLTVNNLLQSRVQLMRFYRNLFLDNADDRKTRVEASPDEAFLKSIYEQLKSNLDKPDFNVGELADLLHMSRSLIYKKIKALTGLSPVEYTRSLRMQEAAKLLRTGQFKVFEVVYMVGFSDLKYFRQCFAKEFGVSPSEYIKQNSALNDAV